MIWRSYRTITCSRLKANGVNKLSARALVVGSLGIQVEAAQPGSPEAVIRTLVNTVEL